MITWIQKYFQHHFRTIFAVLLALIIISFVFITNASGGFGRADRRMVDRPFLNYNLALQSDQQRLFGDAGLSATLRVGAYAQLDNEQIQNYAFQRAATLHLADTWHIPEATNDEIKKQIEGLRMFAGPDGQFDAKAYTTFRDNLKTNPRGRTEADIRRIISDDVRAEKVQELLAGPGYVLPGEIKRQLIQADTTWTLATASADYAAFKPEIKPTDAELTTFFEQAGGRYDIPPRVVVSYLDFPALNYVTQVTVDEAQVRAFYDANPSRFPKPADAPKPAVPSPLLTPPAADPSADFLLVRAQVESALRLERAQKIATKAASDLSLALYKANATTQPAIDALLAQSKLTPKELPAFSREAAPLELSGSPELAAEAFRLSKDRLVSDPVATRNGAMILFWKETQPTRKPQFSEVRDKVAADYIESERRKRFVEAGKSVKVQLEARLKAGDTFEAAVAATAGSGLKLEAKTLAPFTLRNRPQDADYTVLSTLERLEKGQLSDMSMGADKGIFVYAVDKKIPDVTEANPQFAETRKQIASYSGRAGASAYLSELVDQELKRSDPRAP